jgi:hypothetical protein
LRELFGLDTGTEPAGEAEGEVTSLSERRRGKRSG